MSERAASSKSSDAYRTISEVAEGLGLPQHVLRFWETRFPQVKPLKRAGGRRFYRPEDVELLRAVKALLYDDGYTIKGVQRMLRDQGPRSIKALAAAPSSAPGDGLEGASIDAVSLPVRSSGDGSFDLPAPDGHAPQPERASPDPDRRAGTTGSPSPPVSRPARHAPIDVVDRLEAVLHDMAECERLIRQVTAL